MPFNTQIFSHGIAHKQKIRSRICAAEKQRPIDVRLRQHAFVRCSTDFDSRICEPDNGGSLAIELDIFDNNRVQTKTHKHDIGVTHERTRITYAA